MTTARDLARVSAIADYGVLDEEPPPDLRGVVQLAATLCAVSAAVINIIDDRHQHQIAAIGFEPDVCAREDSMCAAVFERGELVVVSDARTDARFATNPFVTGEIATVRLYASSPLVTPEGVPIGTLCVFGDEPGDLSLTQQEALGILATQIVDVLELSRLSRSLRVTNDRLTQVASQLGHDLRNPLSAVAGFLELAIDDPDLEKAPFAVEVLTRAESATARVMAMVSGLVDFARSEGAAPHAETVELSGVVSSVIDDLAKPLADSGARVTVSSDARLVADPSLLAVLLQNLIANAIKFTAAGGTTPHIVVGVEELDDGWRIAVDDNGPGIAPADRVRVFGRSQRAGTGAVPGLGIGLSTCQRIARAHGGGIGIDDSPSGGTRVWVALPRTRGESRG
ncbi:GAF domain-containing sensor histidine kinase [Antiquaquibacter oligotrophicus]|uniref:sensor histidine kinase n=1 Tax=Antiquaquibacter oligotrophicus TaxID=2880260 RepID=UPI002AC9E753|nr:GAF domain-containing sensor histidine kinase [Antiquaquibacter oligotrophicus]UDF13887.1 GAF domain-containing sensor histidine kinase [Antiquaquibacter oligotrophicus]